MTERLKGDELAMQYRARLHYAIGHLRRVSASAQFICRFICDCYCDRYFVHKPQLINSWWFYYMWSNVIGPAFAHVHPKLNVRTVEPAGGAAAAGPASSCGVDVLQD